MCALLLHTKSLIDPTNPTPAAASAWSHVHPFAPQPSQLPTLGWSPAEPSALGSSAPRGDGSSLPCTH